MQSGSSQHHQGSRHRTGGHQSYSSSNYQGSGNYQGGSQSYYQHQANTGKRYQAPPRSDYKQPAQTYYKGAPTTKRSVQYSGGDGGAGANTSEYRGGYQSTISSYQQESGYGNQHYPSSSNRGSGRGGRGRGGYSGTYRGSTRRIQDSYGQSSYQDSHNYQENNQYGNSRENGNGAHDQYKDTADDYYGEEYNHNYAKKSDKNYKNDSRYKEEEIDHYYGEVDDQQAYQYQSRSTGDKYKGEKQQYQKPDRQSYPSNQERNRTDYSYKNKSNYEGGYDQEQQTSSKYDYKQQQSTYDNSKYRDDQYASKKTYSTYQDDTQQSFSRSTVTRGAKRGGGPTTYGPSHQGHQEEEERQPTTESYSGGRGGRNSTTIITVIRGASRGGAKIGESSARVVVAQSRGGKNGYSQNPEQVSHTQNYYGEEKEEQTTSIQQNDAQQESPSNYNDDYRKSTNTQQSNGAIYKYQPKRNPTNSDDQTRDPISQEQNDQKQSVSASHRTVVYNPKDENGNHANPIARESRSSSSWTSVDEHTVDHSNSINENSSIEQSIEKPIVVPAQIQQQENKEVKITPSNPPQKSEPPKKRGPRDQEQKLPEEFTKLKNTHIQFGRPAIPVAKETAAPQKTVEDDQNSNYDQKPIYHLPTLPEPEFKELPQGSKQQQTQINSIESNYSAGGIINKEQLGIQMVISQQMKEFKLSDSYQHQQQLDISPSNGLIVQDQNQYHRNTNDDGQQKSWVRPTQNYRSHIEQQRAILTAQNSDPGPYMQNENFYPPTQFTPGPIFVPSSQSTSAAGAGYLDSQQQDESQYSSQYFDDQSQHQPYYQDGEASQYSQGPGLNHYDPGMQGYMPNDRMQMSQSFNNQGLYQTQSYPTYQDNRGSMYGQLSSSSGNTMNTQAKEFIPQKKRQMIQQYQYEGYSVQENYLLGDQGAPHGVHPMMQMRQQYSFDPYQQQQQQPNQDYINGIPQQQQIYHQQRSFSHQQHYMNEQPGIGGSPQHNYMHDPYMQGQQPQQYDMPQPKQLQLYYENSSGTNPRDLGAAAPMGYPSQQLGYVQQQQNPYAGGVNQYNYHGGHDQDYFEPTAGQQHQVDELVNTADDYGEDQRINALSNQQISH